MLMLGLCQKEFDIWLGGRPAFLSKVDDKIKINNDENEILVDKVSGLHREKTKP